MAFLNNPELDINQSCGRNCRRDMGIMISGAWRAVRTGSWTGPHRGERAPRVGISSTVFGVRGVRALMVRKESCQSRAATHRKSAQIKQNQTELKCVFLWTENTMASMDSLPAKTKMVHTRMRRGAFLKVRFFYKWACV